jgi:L-aminopeptidase/D-esterase-like protein
VLVVNNAVGNVVGRDGALLAGAPVGESAPGEAPASSNTVLVVVATDATLDRADCQRLAAAAHDGIARAVWPAHTLLDGDVAFALATGRTSPPADLAQRLAMEMSAADLVRDALEDSVRAS